MRMEQCTFGHLLDDFPQFGPFLELRGEAKRDARRHIRIVYNITPDYRKETSEAFHIINVLYF